MPYPMPSVPPRVLSVFTQPGGALANKKVYNYVGYFGGVMAPSLPIFTNAPVTRLIALNTGVRFPYAIAPIKFRV